MLYLKRTVGAFIIASSLLPAIAAQAATYYVATTGNNGNPGTESQPWRTVAHAVATMVAGDTTYVQGGLYKEGEIRFAKTGTQALPIKLLNYPGEAPIIDFLDPDSFHRILFQSAAGYQNPIGWITLEGFEIRGGYDGIKFYNLHDSIIRRNWIHHNQIQGILGTGTRNLIDRNKISRNGRFSLCQGADPSVCNKDHGIYVAGTAWTITNNLIYNNLSYGIQMNGNSAYDPSKHPGPEFTNANNWLIANNTFAYNNWRAGIVVWGASASNARIENNIFYENAQNIASGTQGISFVSGGTGHVIRNNLAYATTPGSTGFIAGGTEGVHYTQSGNIVNVSNPSFVNAPQTLPASPAFALTAGSPAIDAGLPLATVKVDITGILRPQGAAYDIGAYEHSVGGDVQSPDAPTRLNIQ